MRQAWIADVLGFWFDELSAKHWFIRDPEVDAAIRRRFGAVYDAATASFALDDALEADDRTLAYAIVLDQFPRNMFRDTPRAFESDHHALLLAKGAVERGLDVRIAPARRLFLYLPFEHSEALADQQRSVELFTALGDAALLGYARAHYDIIARFGRFPHRNAVLRRTSTPDEIAFLAQPGSSF